MQNNAKIGGTLTIVSGALGVLWLSLFILGAVIMAVMPEIMGDDFSQNNGAEILEFFTFMAVFYGLMGVCGVVLGVVAIVGGVFALKKRYWGWALAGAICGTLVFMPCGIPAIIFTTLGKQEFQASALPELPATPG